MRRPERRGGRARIRCGWRSSWRSERKITSFACDWEAPCRATKEWRELSPRHVIHSGTASRAFPAIQWASEIDSVWLFREEKPRDRSPAGLRQYRKCSITASACCLPRNNHSEDTWDDGKAVKCRHCPATVCAFAAAPPFCKKVEYVAPAATNHWVE